MSAVISTPAPTADLAAVKSKQHMAWSSGDYAVVGTTLQIVGESLCEALDVRAGERVLDVAAGNGNATLAAARRWCDVVSTDYVPALLERGRTRASAEGLQIRFEQADAEKLPYENHSFNVVMSTFGVMFTPDQNKAASEMMRVCKPGGRIGLANWTPGSLVGEIFKLLGKYLPPAAGVKSPALWGTEARLSELFDDRLDTMKIEHRNFMFRYHSAAHWLEVFRTFYGPIHKAFGALDTEKQAALSTDLIALVEKFNRATDGTLVASSEYLEVVITLK
ncbi:MAG: class I SAM-dependent methyltransferase [Gammaproteobacteria bacterium]|nr:class I SAM-dependent methyltransferase [Gammaproteobacteria bacterium]